MCDDLLALHHRISAPSSIPLSSNPTWFTTQPAALSDAPPRTYLFLPLSFSIDPATCLSTSGSPATRKKAIPAPSAEATATTIFDYFPAFFDINKRWTIYAFDKSVLALYPQKADRCEMIYEMVYSHAEHAPRYLLHPQLPSQHHHHHRDHHPHNLHTPASPPRGRIGYPSSTPHSRSSSPGPHHHSHHHTPHISSSYDLVEDTSWFTSTHPHLRTLLNPPNGFGSTGEKCLSLIDLHSPPASRKNVQGTSSSASPPLAAQTASIFPASRSFPSIAAQGVVGTGVWLGGDWSRCCLRRWWRLRGILTGAGLLGRA
ncbi:hypothetical protein BGX38DRAFT_54042 [Terfezia claveryi]|nr:hypothetical protein BGX38DRAFT_54042 [Terfezia claveryi]